MWIIKKPDTISELISNNPGDNIAEVLIKRNPYAVIYRSQEPVFNVFAALVNATREEEGELIEQQVLRLDEQSEPVLVDGEPAFDTVTVSGPRHVVPVGNTYTLEEGPIVIVRSPGGEVLLTVPMEQLNA